MDNAYETIQCFTLLPDDRAALGTSFGLYLFNARSGKQIRELQGHTGIVWAVAPSPDGRFLLSASKDQTLRIWDPDRDLPVLSLFFAGDDWIAWTPEGYYAASPGGEQLMGWHVNNGLAAMASYYPASHFRKTLYRPDVIKRLLESGSLDKALADANTAAGRRSAQTEVAEILPPRVTITSPGISKVQVHGKTLNVEAAASSVGANPVTGMRLLLDGRPVPDGLKTFPSPVLGEVHKSWTLEVPPGSHRLTVQADSAVSKGVSDPIDVVGAGEAGGSALAKATATLHVLAVGINDYRDKRLKLDCAAPDARALHQSFLSHSRPLFRSVEARLLLDGQATRANILAELRRLSTAVKPGDVAVVFYAGHGDCKREGEFFLIPVDANVRDLKATGVSGESLKQALGNLPCTTVLLLDACYSGSFDDAKKGRKKRALPASGDAVVRDLVYDAGLVVMCGASKEQEAAEEDGRGFFTRALTEGMGGKADYNKDGRVELYELQLFVSASARAVCQRAGSHDLDPLGRPLLPPLPTLNPRSFPMRCLVPLLVGFAFASFARADDAIEKPTLVLDAGGHTAIVKKVLFTPDGRELITVSYDKTIRIWEASSGEPLRILRPPIGPGQEGMLFAAALSPNGRTLAVGGFRPGWSKDGHPIYLIALSDGRIARVLKGHSNIINDIAFTSDGLRLASASYDKTARIWGLADGRCEQVLKEHTESVSGVVFSPDGRHLATASYDKTGRIWSVATGAVRGRPARS